MGAAEKVDLKKDLPSYAARAGRIDLVDVPALRYLMVDAEGAPEGASFISAVETLYPVAYATKFASKVTAGRDYVVPPLEALWWADDMDAFTVRRDRSQWRSTVMIVVPEWVDDTLIEAGMDKAARKVDAPSLGRVRVETLVEGRCAQTLHLGPFADEGPVIEAMHAAIADAGLSLGGRHHEIYLSDPRRSAPERLRTILRQPAV
ncbi:GyrI-like domain-containing protein [Demequina sp. NBRC 110056]|uniref:GyrI-like domain-containing protein n=1 Tax=Demequina sp. NBRC 110056 TaxID=1570345 RepID=UPI000A075063|nr:GyrI-like domain-containing protein [Demequina sp. NBRC 110056]